MWFSSDNPFAEGLSSFEVKENQQYYNQQLLERTKAEQAARAKLGLGGFSPEEARTKVNNYDWDHNIKFTPLEKLGKATANSKLLGSLSSKIADAGGGKVGGALAKLFGFGESAAAAQAAAGLATAIGGITIAAGVAAIAIKTLYDLSPAGQVKIAEKYAKVMSEISDNAKKIADSYKSAQEKLKEYDDTLSEASTASKRSDIIKERNDYIMQQMQEDSSLAKYVKSNYENGELVLTLDEKSFAEATKRAAEAAEKAAVGSDFAQAALAGRQANRYRSKFEALDWKRQQLVLDGETLTAEQELLYRQYQTQMDESNRQMRQYAQKAFSQLIDPQEVGDDIANLMSEALAEGFQDEQIITGTGWLRSRTHWQNEYMKYYGQKADSSMETADIYSAVQQAKKVKENQGRVDELGKLLSGPGAEGVQTIVSSWLGSYDFSGVNLTLSDVNLDTLLGSDENLEPIAKALNTTVPELKKTIQNNVELEKKRQQKVNYDTAQKIASYGGTDEDIARRIVDVVSLSSFEEQQAVNDLLNSIDNENIATTLLDNLDNSGFREWITSLDFSNPITSLLELQKTAKNSEGVIKDLATSLQDETQFSASSLLQYFASSSDYESLTESLGEFIDENDKLTSSKILELAEANKTLNDLLKTGQVSAAGLAAALTGIEKGTVFVGDLNDSILAALNSLDDLDGLVKRTIDDLGNFDPGYDENDVASFIKKVFDLSKENIEKGAWGNNQMRNYMEYIFGSYKGAPGDEYTAWLQTGLNWLNANKENMKSAWADIAYASEEAAVASGKAIPIWQENGEIVIDIGQHTTDELAALLQEQTTLTEQQIRMMIADYKNYSDDFALTLERNDLKNVVSVWAQEAGAQGWYLDKDLQTLAAALGVDVGEINNILKELNPDLEEIKFGEGSVEDIERILGEVTSYRKGEHYNKNLDTYFYNDLIDYDQLKQSMADADLAGYFESTLNQMLQAGDSFMADFGRGLETVTINAGETATIALARQAEESARTALAGDIGEAVAKALGEVGINVNTDNAKTAIETLFGDLKTAYKTADMYSTSINISTDTAAKNIRDLASAYSGLARSIEAVSTAGSGGTGGNSSRGTTSSSIPSTHALGAGAMGGYVSSYGSGSYRVEPGTALTGEEDPEIVWNKEKGYAYITGKNGPEFQNLQPGDRVFNAQETKKILRNSSVAKGGIVPSYASRPVHGYGGVTTGSGSDSDKYQKQSTWRNELDWLYDLMEDIAEYERQQNIIQARNELALEDIASSGRALYKLTREELTNLETQLDGQQAAQLKRLQQMGELQTQVNAAGYGRYMQWNQQDQTLEIDWDAIEAIQDKETYDEVVDWLNRMESVQDQIDDAEDAMWDIKKQIQELQQRYLQKYLDFQNRVLDAIVKQYQDQIDKLSEINDNVNDTNASILDSIQREIDLERQIRDNTDAESNIADMEARLAYLQRDTTGANATEIRQLQKQLDEARLSYGDTLIDQAVDRLSQSNEDAAAQREKQIELMQAQLDYWQESGGLWGEVEQLISTGFNGNGSLIRGSDLEKVLQNAENYEAMSQAQRDNWANELILETNQVGAHILELANGMNVNAEQIRALLTNLTGRLGGTPVHSYTAEKAEEKYATGGLNTYTGLAHLDGTPSAPEYVLNPEQTNAFLRLADVLPSIMGGDSIGGTTYGGDIYLNLSMHVDEIASDYDVDRIADRVKDILYDASSYRNVNTLNFIR